MYYEKTKSGSYRVCERYKDPLTGKMKKTYVTYKSNTSRARKQAERELEDRCHHKSTYLWKCQPYKNMGAIKR